MSSLSGGSPPHDVSVSDPSNSDDDDGFVLRTIRQLPLPVAPPATAGSHSGVAPPAPAQLAVEPQQAGRLAVQHPVNVAGVLPVPRPIASNVALHTPSIADTSVARIPLPLIPLTAASGATLTLSSSSDSLRTEVVLATTRAGAPGKALDAASVPTAPSQSTTSSALSRSPHASSSALNAIASPTPISSNGSARSAGALQLPPPLPPTVLQPAPSLPVPALKGSSTATGIATSSGITAAMQYAVTTLRPQPANASALVPTTVDVSLPSASISVAPVAPPSFSASPYVPVPQGVEAAQGVHPLQDADSKEAKPRHLIRKKDALEQTDCALFTSPDREGDSEFSSDTSSDDDDDVVYVGRTRRVGASAAGERERQTRQDTAAGDAAGHHTSRSHRHRSRSSHARRQKKMVVKLANIEGKDGSREKASQSSQSTNALTPDNPARLAHRKPSASAPSVVRSNAASPGGHAEDDQHDSSTLSDGEAPLAFLSPAARFAALCEASTKNKGPARRTAQRLSRSSVLGYSDDGVHGVDIAVGEGDDDGASSDHAGAGTVRFRITGAFSDSASDSKVLATSAHERVDASHGGGGVHAKVHRTGERSSGEAASGATVLALTIRGMSPLHADASVVHPFVRVWIVSCVTGQSLVQASAAVPCAVTQPFDLRAHRTRAPWWEAEVALRLSTERLRGAASDAMVLLEVLDFGNETISGFPLLRSGLYPICWGYLMLRDCTGRSTLAMAENIHLQLFRYPQRTPWYLRWLEALMPTSWSAAGAHLQPYDLRNALGTRNTNRAGGLAVPDVPSIYHIFKIHCNRKVPYEGGMVISLRQHSSAQYVPGTTDMLPYEEYLLSMLVSGGGSCAVPRSVHASSFSGDADDNDEARASRGRLMSSVPASPWATAASENYYRMDGERSLLPHDVLQTTAVSGAVTCVAFAHNGTLFALGVYRHLQYLIELRNPLLPDMPVLATLLGHTGHLHCLAFQKEDRYLLSCSSDGTVRVWQPAHPNTPFSAEKCAGEASVECVCTLPHGFPVYTAMFHQEKIIAGGFSDQIFVWCYERPLESELPSMATAEDSALHLTATFTPELQTTQIEGVASKPARVLLGELVYRVDNAGVLTDGGEPTITLSLASNERSNRVWSVHANGAVICWRAVAEATERGGRAAAASTSHNWQMSVRHKADCDGASEVQVNGSYAIVVCGRAPLVFVFDATTCTQLRVVSTRLPAATPVSLLPDGEAFVGAVGDQGKLVAWECFDGALCTPATGYAWASPLFGVARMCWAESQQLALLVSRSPCTEDDMVRFVRGPSVPAPGQSAAAYYYAKQEEQYRLEGIPAEMTLLTVAGTVRRRSTVIQTGDGRASGAFCAMFGGDIKAKRKAEYLAQRTQASRKQETERDSRRARLHQESMMADTSSAFAAATTTIPYDATEKGARMNAIINFWRGLVGQHKHGAEDLERMDSKALGGLRSPPKPSTHRALMYLDEEDKDAEV